MNILLRRELGSFYKIVIDQLHRVKQSIIKQHFN